MQNILVRQFEKNLHLTIIGPTRTINDKIFSPTKVAVVGPAPPALSGDKLEEET